MRFQSTATGVQTPADPGRYVMELLAGGRLALQLDCNRATGRWEAKANGADGTISLGAPAMTRAACPPGSWDTRLARDLGRIRAHTLDGDRLSLALDGYGGVYTWERLPQ